MNRTFELSIKSGLHLLLLLSAVIRLFLASWLELGNDEVYYWTYALYPDWSHFDHPPMVGLVIQLFSLNLFFDHALFLRLASVVMMTMNTWLIFRIGVLVRDELSGFYAALLYTASVYAFVITGIFILPDTPQTFFWMLSIWLMVKLIKSDENARQFKFLFLAIGLTIGLGMLSKYTSVFLWLGLGSFILFHRISWLRKPVVYFSAFLSLLVFLPVLWWNFSNDFISFSFQGERVNVFASGLRPELFFTELAGQFVYNNPVNFILILLALIGIMRGKSYTDSAVQQILLWSSLPLVFIFLFFSFFRATLPHWTGPAYNILLLLAAARLATLFPIKRGVIQLPGSIKAALLLLLVPVIIGALQIQYGIIPIQQNNPYHRLGRHDVTLDMYGWKQLEAAFKKVRLKHLYLGTMQADDALVGENWFPLANIDYYVARPLAMKAFGLGKPQRLHKYLWINKYRGGLTLGSDYWYITNSRDYKHPEEVYSNWFKEIRAADTIEIYRSDEVVKRFFVFQLFDLQQLPEPFVK